MKTILLFLTAVLLLTPASAQSSSNPCESIKNERDQFHKTLQDWPNLERYRDADAKLPPAEDARVVFLGDSITESWDLAASFPGQPYLNRGISGQTTPQMLVRFRQDVIALKPKAVVILAGTNDIAENTGPTTLGAIEDNLMSMVDLAKKNGIRVVVASVLPAARYPWRPDLDPGERIPSLNTWLKEYSRTEGVVFLDFYSAMVDQKGAGALKANLSEDGVHPNKDGYAVMAPLAQKAVAEALRKK